MTKIKLVDGTVLNASSVELVNGILKITTAESTVEELAMLFGDKNNTNHIELLTAKGVKSGYKNGFTSFAGIMYDTDGNKTVELFQPVDATEARISNMEGVANSAVAAANTANDKAAILEETLDSILTDIIPSLSV